MQTNEIFADGPQMRGTGALAAVARTLLRALGWRTHAPVTLARKCVIIVYPHTSNWDFPVGLLYKWATGMEVNYLGKDSLFQSPLGWFFRATGGIPVDRKSPRGLVEAMTARFAMAGTTRLVIAPEGTRSYVPTLKSGFYRIARDARVPLVCTTIDFASKRVGLLAMLDLSGDQARDLEAIRSVYSGVMGRTPANMGAIKLPD
jgi:1-acyl-sn-glycerol-3-phosphate acyltransferase